jgi:NTP pyrophosphatase (non-canonical NTP hydrolase)
MNSWRYWRQSEHTKRFIEVNALVEQYEQKARPDGTAHGNQRRTCRKFPNSHVPFQIMTRLLEECGELAEQVNHLDTGVKREKHGEPDKAKLAKKVKDVLGCALQIAQYYGIELDLEASIENSYRRLKAEGFIE